MKRSLTISNYKNYPWSLYNFRQSNTGSCSTVWHTYKCPKRFKEFLELSNWTKYSCWKYSWYLTKYITYFDNVLVIVLLCEHDAEFHLYNTLHRIVPYNSNMSVFSTTRLPWNCLTGNVLFLILGEYLNWIYSAY